MSEMIILLNGPSSSGKSTLAEALSSLIKERRNEEYEIVSIDDFMKISTDETIYEDDVFEISGSMCEAAVEYIKSGKGVIIDHVITSERIFDQFKQMCGCYPIRLIKVSCPLEVLLKREKERGNRYEGSAKDSYTYLYPVEGYDITVDTGTLNSKQCAEAVYEYCFSKK
ncbi:MAG: AAA family ATPase [Erysipelotrichaceae bacterium]|nr:AAA family ATPase [Erysipelotrichaceae bacterium]